MESYRLEAKYKEATYFSNSASKTVEESFKEIYKNVDENELKELLQLESDVYIPVLDDPITESEVKSAYRNLKKSCYDYALPVTNILVSSLTVTLLYI